MRLKWIRVIAMALILAFAMSGLVMAKGGARQSGGQKDTEQQSKDAKQSSKTSKGTNRSSSGTSRQGKHTSKQTTPPADPGVTEDVVQQDGKALLGEGVVAAGIGIMPLTLVVSPDTSISFDDTTGIATITSADYTGTVLTNNLGALLTTANMTWTDLKELNFDDMSGSNVTTLVNGMIVIALGYAPNDFAKNSLQALTFKLSEDLTSIPFLNGVSFNGRLDALVNNSNNNLEINFTLGNSTNTTDSAFFESSKLKSLRLEDGADLTFNKSNTGLNITVTDGKLILDGNVGFKGIDVGMGGQLFDTTVGGLSNAQLSSITFADTTPVSLAAGTSPNNNASLPGDFAYCTGTLPAGLSWDAAAGIFSGTPRAGGTFTVYMKDTQTGLLTSYTITIAAPRTSGSGYVPPNPVNSTDKVPYAEVNGIGIGKPLAGNLVAYIKSTLKGKIAFTLTPGDEFTVWAVYNKAALIEKDSVRGHVALNNSNITLFANLLARTNKKCSVFVEPKNNAQTLGNLAKNFDVGVVALVGGWAHITYSVDGEEFDGWVYIKNIKFVVD